MTANNIPLKDLLFHRDNVARIADEIAVVYPAFDVGRFTSEVVASFPRLELKARIAAIANGLADRLPGEFRHAVRILVDALPPPCDPQRRDGDFGDFIYAAYSRYVADHGCDPENLVASLAALREITTRFSAEDAIRPFIDAFPDHTLGVLHEWTTDTHYHVRRLCSEGTRPLLPWSARLTVPVDAAVPILDNLFGDPTRFVTRSVANHLNDIAKHNPRLVIDVLERWLASGRQSPTEVAYLVRHASRTLIKRGDRLALSLLGVTLDVPVRVVKFSRSDVVQLGQAIELELTLVADHDADVVVDYALSFPGPTGRLGRKVYKLGRVQLRGGVPITLNKRHPLRGDMTTRRIISGHHELEILVNGESARHHHFKVRSTEHTSRQ